MANIQAIRRVARNPTMPGIPAFPSDNFSSTRDVVPDPDTGSVGCGPRVAR